MPYIGTSPSNGVRRVFDYTATAGQTSFSGSDNNSQTLAYTDSAYIDVYQNGVLLIPSDYTATTGTTVVLDTGATVSDSVQIVVYDVFSVADTVSKADGGTFDGNVTMAGTLGVTGDTTLSSDLTIPDKIIHSGDTDTFINFSDANEVKIETGGVEIVKFSSGATVFNNGGADMDTRFEGDADTALLFLDAGSDQVCMGTTTTISNTKLNVSGGPIKCTFNSGAAPTSTNANQFVDAGSSTYNTLFHNTNSSPGAQYIMEIRFKNSSPDNNSAKFLECRDSTTNRFYIDSDGDVKNHDNSYGAISDIKLKEQISDATSQWDDIKALKVRKFKFKTDVATGDSDAHWRLGVIAQEVETAGMNGLVTDDVDTEEQDGVITSLGTTTKTVKYSILYMKAVKALQEAMTRIETLEAEVKALKGE